MSKGKVLVTAGLCCCVSVLAWAGHAEAAANKVNICHYSADAGLYHELSVAASAVPGHLGHGDCVVDDGDACTVDSCDATAGCIHAFIVCNDDNPCTDDVCNGGVCEYTPDDTNSCEDGVFCNGTASCLDGSCVAVSACPPIGDRCLVVTCDEENDECDITGKCDDGTFCTTDFCDPETGDCGYIDTCPAAIDPENCLVYGRCDEEAQTCPADPLEPCCGNGIVEAGEECESHADCPAGTVCIGCTCTTGPDPECAGQVCGGLLNCNPEAGCGFSLCVTLAEGGGVCTRDFFCAGLPGCTGSVDCPDGGVCAVGTCCGTNVCIPPSSFCPPVGP